ncbi:hypothetical protein HCN44_006162 [Aphidius gifuensis]|uniref:Uncharacterized protein n=1 Tax=Aphidius gifuensis TaxID=684658 RepID=A0A834Y6T6_APHGI|nr:piwi-like protein Siwi [Aphidius gifuensis]KAF7997591.1 hypothetical protein HCN44_006162 [Aphidius gifuensis]
MDTGRGRSRGRARTRPPQTEAPRQGPPQSGPHAAPGPALQGQWAARRPGAEPPAAAAASSTEQYPAMAPRASIGRSVRAAGPPIYQRSTSIDSTLSTEAQRSIQVSGTPEDSGAAAGAPPGRGAMRGRRQLDPVTRPSQWLESKKGSSGKPFNFRSNYFKLTAAPDWCLYQYHVDIQPEEDRTFVRKGLLGLHREKLGGYMFDGTSLYLCARLANDVSEFTSTRQSDGVQMRIIVKLTGTLEKGDPHYLQFYNVLMRKCLSHLKLQLVGRNFFDPHAKVEIREHHFELWPGYITSIRQHEQDLLMCCEITHKVMRQENLLNIMNRIREEKGGGDFQAACKADVIGTTVLTEYNNNTYRVEDIDFQTKPSSTFHLKKENREISYAEYYRNKYNINIRNMTQPMLVTRTTDKDRRSGQAEIVYLVPELCRATGITDAMRNDFRLMDAMAQHTRINAQQRVQKLNAFNKRLYGEPLVVSEFRQWNLQLEKELITVPARVLDEAKIIFANNNSVGAGQGADWTNAFRNNGLLQPAPLNDWVVLVPEKLARDARSFVQNMQRSLKNFQMRDPRYIEMRNDSAQSFTNELDKVLSQSNPQIVFCIVFKQRGDIYSAIKKKCCVDRPVPSQVVTSKCFNPKRMMSIATKVAIQMNCKIGGYPWSIAIPMKGLMVIGFDVCHDTNQKGKDFGAMVASLDSSFGRYFSAVSFHSSNEELSNDLAVNITKALHKYREYNNALPQQIVIYRDGVGEGQVPYVFEHEVQNIRSRVANFYQKGPTEIQMAYVVVTKRLNTRLFADNRGQIGNPPPGTIVDDVITCPTKYDFFVVAQAVRQGSVAPTSFSVIDDNVGLPPDRMQQLTYRLMHMYFNWSGTVKVPAPVQFAHKLAFLVSQSIHSAPSSHLDSLLYFL